jgi:DNA-binding response OmpR family regulator
MKKSVKNGNGRQQDIAASKQPCKRILIADDDPGIRDVYTIIFEKAGFIVDLKEDGADLMANDFVVPDFFLIDKQLSGYSGLDICQHLKHHSRTKNIPVVIISAAPNIGKLSQEAGADGFLEKPFELSKLLETVATFTKKRA